MADSEDPTKLVFDEHGNLLYDDEYLDENLTGTCELYVSTTEETYNDIDYNWDNENIEPEGAEYVTPRFMETEVGVEDINNFDIGNQLSNLNISSPVINAIEFTGHAKQVLIICLVFRLVMYLMKITI